MIVSKLNTFYLALLTPIYVLLSHYCAVFPHEYAHSFTAWLLGYKNNPFLIDYGGSDIANLLLLVNIDENIDYKLIFSLGKNSHVALISFVGFGVANLLLYCASLFVIRSKTIILKSSVFYFLFWFNLMNIANLYDYIPIRTFSNTGKGDIGHFTEALNISPWWVYIIGGYIVAFIIWDFFSKTLPLTYVKLSINSTIGRGFLMSSCVLILFGYFSLPGLLGNYGEISRFLTLTSLVSIPGIIIACWPTRNWVKR